MNNRDYLIRYLDSNYSRFERHASGAQYFGDKVKIEFYAEATKANCLEAQSESEGAINFAFIIGVIGGHEAKRLKLEVSRWPDTVEAERSSR